MKILHQFVVLFLLLVNGAYGLETSSEAVNPFNEYYSGGLVNEFTGIGQASLPIAKIGSADIGLRYSSNVTRNAIASNLVAPTGVVGLGWNMGFGSVVADHKNTSTADDDEYVFINSNGVAKKILTAQKLEYKLYDLNEHNWDRYPQPDLSPLIPKEVGFTDNFNVHLSKESEKFGLTFSGCIKIDREGNYTFKTKSDDGVRFLIYNKTENGSYTWTTLVDNWTVHSVQENTSSPIQLTPGYYQIRLDYFQRFEGAILEVYLGENTSPTERIANKLLFNDKAMWENCRQYFIEDDPFTKVERVLDATGKCSGWIITDVSGRKYYYGDLSFSEQHKATQYVFSSPLSGFVGNIISGQPVKYGYKWDIAQIEETAGIVTDFYYDPKPRPIHCGKFQSDHLATPLYYTRESHIASIKASTGEKAVFTYEDKSIDGVKEYIDPVTTSGGEPDAFMEFYDTLRLKSIDVFLPGRDACIKNYSCKYKYLNPGNNYNDFVKSLLTDVEERVYGVLLHTTKFAYNDNADKSSSDKETYHYGALSEIKDDYGKTITMNYRLQPTQLSSVWHKIRDVSPTFFGDSLLRIGAGTYDNGKEYLVLLKITQVNDKKRYNLSIVYFENNQWVSDPNYTDEFIGEITSAIPPAVEKSYLCYAGENCFVINNGSKNCTVYTRYEGKWCKQVLDITVDHEQQYSADYISVGNDFVVVRGGEGEHRSDDIWVYRRYGSVWQLCEYIKDSNFGENEIAKEISIGKDFFVIRPVGDDQHHNYDFDHKGRSRWVTVVRWNGEQWIQTKIYASNDESFSFKSLVTGTDFIVFIGGDAGDVEDDKLWVYRFDGNNWTPSPNFNGDDGIYLAGKDNSLNDHRTVKTHHDYFVVRSINKDDCWIVEWMGTDWDWKKLPEYSEDYIYGECYPGKDFLAIKLDQKLGSSPRAEILQVYNRKYNEGNIEAKWFQSVWSEQKTCQNGENEMFDILPFYNAFAIAHKPIDNDNTISCTKNTYELYSYNGSSWNKVYEHQVDNPDRKNDIELGGIQNGVLMHTYRECNTCTPKFFKEDMLLLRRYQDNYSTVSNYVVDSVTEKSYPQVLNNSTKYTYSDYTYDGYNGVPMFNKVTIEKKSIEEIEIDGCLTPKTVTEKYGRTEMYFFNNSAMNSQREQIVAAPDDISPLNGLCYRIVKGRGVYGDKKEIDNVISNSSQVYNITKARSYWPSNLFHVTLAKSNSELYGGLTESMFSYNDTNGLVSNSKVKVNDTLWSNSFKYAFSDSKSPTEMSYLNKYMLSQVAEKSMYKELLRDENVISRYPLEFQAYTWKKDQKTERILPLAQYALNAPMNNQGFITSYIFPFDGTESNSWECSGTIDKVNAFGQTIQATDKTKIKTSQVFRGDNHKVIATFTNAGFEESGVYTCDYDANNDDYLDKDNGWINNPNGNRSGSSSIVTEDAKHFGVKGIKVTNAFGPTRNFKLEKGKDYILSAWIKSVNGNVPMLKDIVMGVDYRKCINGDEFPLELGAHEFGTSGSLRSESFGDWNYVELEIPASKDISEVNWTTNKIQYARVWVGVPNGNGTSNGTVYIDDIRFYPKDALVNSVYYDDKFQLPVCSVDENNFPGNNVEYDQFGRVSTVKKTDITKATTDPAYLQPLTKKEYHKRNELGENESLKLLTPDGNEKFTEKDVIPIEWLSKENGTVDIYYENEDGTNNTLIKSNVHSNIGYNKYEWEIPAIGCSLKKIRLISGNEISKSSEAFSVYMLSSGETDAQIKLTSPENNKRSVSAAGLHLEWEFPIENSKENIGVVYDVYVGKWDGSTTIPNINYNMHWSTTSKSFTIPITLESGVAYKWYVTAVVTRKMGTSYYRESEKFDFLTTNDIFKVTINLDNGEESILTFYPDDPLNKEFNINFQELYSKNPKWWPSGSSTTFEGWFRTNRRWSIYNKDKAIDGIVEEGYYDLVSKSFYMPKRSVYIWVHN